MGFFRKGKTGVVQAASGPITDDELGRSGLPGKPFAIGAWLDMVHYGDTGWSVMISGEELLVFGPPPADVDQAKPYKFPIKNIPRNKWQRLGMRGTVLPISVHLRNGVMHGKWEPLSPAPPAASSRAVNDSRDATRALEGGLTAARRTINRRNK